MKIYRYCGVFLLTLFLSVQLCTNVSAAESVQNSIGISELSGLTEDNEEIYEFPFLTNERLHVAIAFVDLSFISIFSKSSVLICVSIGISYISSLSSVKPERNARS